MPYLRNGAYDKNLDEQHYVDKYAAWTSAPAETIEAHNLKDPKRCFKSFARAWLNYPSWSSEAHKISNSSKRPWTGVLAMRVHNNSKYFLNYFRSRVSAVSAGTLSYEMRLWTWCCSFHLLSSAPSLILSTYLFQPEAVDCLLQ